jgi:hypothetical protein
VVLIGLVHVVAEKVLKVLFMRGLALRFREHFSECRKAAVVCADGIAQAAVSSIV